MALPGIQSQPLPQTGTNPATADAMPSWLTLSHVQGMAEGTNQFSQPQPCHRHSLLP
ncbi:hypothetical protein AH4AK4_2945 [Aeromonas hydrophila 4AK4]|nr:hypothetical protein AH4AK4_2945 [Aeromonas hydrophila 4AK4]